MKIDVVGDAYASRSKNENAQQCINLFLETDPTGKSPVALYGTPGSSLQYTLLAAEVRAAFEYDGVAYWVSGNRFYTASAGGNTLAVGTLTTNTGFVKMVTNGLVVLIVDGSDGYTFTISTATFATISDGDFPDNPTSCDMLDNTFLVIDGGTQLFYISTDGSSWDPADFASAESSPDDLIGLLVDHQEILLGGTETIEVWYNSGDSTFTFSRRATIETGLAGVGALCKADNSIFFLGNDKQVWRLNGYTPVRVSTHAVEHAINKMSRVDDARLWAQKEEGHVFIWCQFPSGNQTWVFDVASGRWHQRAWRNPDTGALHRHRANCYVFFNNQHLIGDFEDGRVYELDLDTYDDDGDELAAIRVTGHVTSKDTMTAVRMNYLTVDCETGVGLASGQGSDPQMVLKVSYDGGHTFESEMTASIGQTGEYTATVKFDRLGSIRYPDSAVFWLEVTDPVKRVLIGGELGTS